jgi:hypothetical protein
VKKIYDILSNQIEIKLKLKPLRASLIHNNYNPVMRIGIEIEVKNIVISTTIITTEMTLATIIFTST